ncbi:hypothetical protein [Sphingomonas sp.]|jgi:plasmid maintenance system antidote protein VapI|uniref:hypothetical protein n=1 Tax=Sphingomonas sp. TaxID=28214 RepID=UPI002E345A14|nr:hypothetical protein [Sphingomonas sp.]HEX4693387.1 hypothetical protein [Sphingomonas sp.]
MAIKVHLSFAVHPGAWLRAEMVEPHGLSVTDAAAKLRVTRRAMAICGAAAPACRRK